MLIQNIETYKSDIVDKLLGSIRYDQTIPQDVEVVQYSDDDRVAYQMENVPLRLGVKINTDDQYYCQEAVDVYKQRAMLHMKNDIKRARIEQLEKEKSIKQMQNRKLSPSDYHDKAKRDLANIKKQISFAI